MSEPEIFETLRGLLTTHNLTKVADSADISYPILWRFKNKQGKLSLADAEKLCVKLTGKTFIVTPDV